MFLVNSRYPLVCATLLSSESKSRHQRGSSFFRSYGGNLPSSLTIVLPLALVFSTRPPVSVWGTGTVPAHCWAFLGSIGISDFAVCRSASRLSVTPNSHREPPTRLPRDYHRPGSLYPSCVPRQLSASSSVGSLNIKMNSPNVATIGLGAGTVVLEYQPVVHRLRLSASP